MIYIFVFILGLVLGSFLNVCGYRLSKGESITNPKRSYCENCKHELKAIDLIPVISYIFNKGRCRYCNIKLSLFYPISEILCGILYLTSYKVFGFSLEFMYSIIISSYLIMVMISDINFLIIPDEITLIISILLIIICLIFEGINILIIRIITGLLIFIFMYLLMLLGNFIFKKESLGGADIKLMFISGFILSSKELLFKNDILFNIFSIFTNLLPSFIVLFIASSLALPVSLFLYERNKEKVVPFGPFLVLAILFIFIFKLDTSKLIDIFTLV